jgi:hypothetical protein
MGEPDPADTAADTAEDTAEAGVSPLRNEDAGPALVLVAAAPAAATRARGWLLFPGLPLAAIMAISVFFRFWELAAVGFNSDEAVYTGSASSIAGNHTLSSMFPVFRAHPLLFQTLLSTVLRVHDTDWSARAFAAAIGVATVAVTYLLGRRLYGTGAGLVAALLLAVMPYHVVVSRQVLLDGLMTLCATVALYCVVRYVESGRLTWLLGGGAMMGAAVLSKETSIVLLGGLYAFFVLTPFARLRVKHLLLTLLLLAAEIAVWPAMIRLSGHSRTGQSYLLWQMFRRPNHGTWFYLTVLPAWIGPALLVAALAGLIWLRKEATWRERLLLAWLIVPMLFFTLWPVKGFEYLLPVAPPLAILAGRALSRPLPGWFRQSARLERPARPRRSARLELPAQLELPAKLELPAQLERPARLELAARVERPPRFERLARLELLARLRIPRWLAAPKAAQRAAMGVLAAATVVSMAVPAWARVEPSTSTAFLAGSGGLNGGRQAGNWILRNVPQGARLLAIGPSVANVLEFYGHHQVSALSISTDPHNRNPAYTPVPNSDLALRHGDFQYVVWDAYTAARSPFFAGQARRLAAKYHGVAVFTSTVTARAPSGLNVAEPVIIIYEVHP